MTSNQKRGWLEQLGFTGTLATGLLVGGDKIVSAQPPVPKVAQHNPELEKLLHTLKVEYKGVRPPEAELKQLIADLGSSVYSKRDVATKKLAKYGNAIQVELQAAAKSGDAELSYRAKELLKNPLDVYQQHTLPLVTAIRQLGEFGPAGGKAVPMLIEILEKDFSLELFHWQELHLKEATIKTLGNLGLDAKSAAPTLLTLVKNNTNFRIRGAAVEALGKFGTETEETMAALKLGLVDDHYAVRSSAAIAAGNLGKNAKTMVPHLIDALKDTGTLPRWNAAEALGKIGDGAAIPALEQMIKREGHDGVRKTAIEALEAIRRTPMQKKESPSLQSHSK